MTWVALGVGLTSPMATADDASGIEVIEVSGQRISGANVVHVTDIQRKQANDLEDLFRDQSNITVGGSFGAAQKIYVRGIEDMNLNVTIDGASQSGQLFQHQGRLAIEPEMLKQVEVKAGAGTALDGFGALGGAIRFETKGVDDLLGTDEQFGARLKTGYFNNTQGYRASTNLYGRFNEQWNGLLILGKNDTDDIDAGNGQALANTATKQELGLVKLTGEIAPNHSLTLSHEHRIDDGRRNLRTHFYTAPWNQAVDQRTRRKTTTLTYAHDGMDDVIDLQLTAYKTDNYFAYSDHHGRGGATVKSYGFDLRNTSLIGEHELIYGIEYKDDQAYPATNRLEENNQAYAIYAQDLFALTPALSLSYGLRYDHYHLDDANNQRLSASGFSPNLNMAYQFNDHWSARAGYSTAMRGPQTKQAMVIGEVPHHPALKKEEADNTELSLAYQHQGLTARATVFQSNIDDVITLMGPPGPGSNQFFGNDGNLETRGFSLLLAKRWMNAGLSATYSRTDPEIDGQPLDDGHFGIGTSFGDTLVINANYHFPQHSLELGWSGRLVKRLDKVRQGYPAKAGYSIHDLYVEWFALADESLSINFTVSNLFDRHYYDHGTFGFDPDSGERIGLPEPGRDLRLTLGWQF